MEEPAPKIMKVSNCLICNSNNSQLTGFPAKYTNLVILYFISSPEQKWFSSRKCFDFCCNCVELLDELHQLKDGLDFILKSIKEKEDEIKHKIVNTSTINKDEDINKFREIATKDLSPKIEMFRNNALFQNMPPMSLQPVKQKPQNLQYENIQMISSLKTEFEHDPFCENMTMISSETNVKVEATEVEGGIIIVSNENDFQSTADAYNEISTYPNFSECVNNEGAGLSSCNINFENNATLICSASNNFIKTEDNMSSAVCQEDEYANNVNIQSSSSYGQSYDVEEETAFQFEPWATSKQDDDDDNDTFEIIPPEMPPTSNVEENETYSDSDDIGTRMKKIVAIVNPNTNIKVWKKPPLSPTQLCILAIMSKDNMLMMIPDLFVFISNNFPYFMLETEVWKSQIKEALLTKYFREYKCDLNKEGEMRLASKITVMYSVLGSHTHSLRKEIIDILSVKDFSASMAYPDRLFYFQSVLKRKVNAIPVHSKSISEYAASKINNSSGIEKEGEARFKVRKVHPKLPFKGHRKEKKPKSDCNIIEATPVGEMYPPTPLSFKNLAIVAIMNTSCKLASAPDIFQFIMENFPYFGSMKSSQLTSYKRVLRTVLQQSQFTLHSYWNDINSEDSQCVSKFEDLEAYKIIYTVNDSFTSKDFNRQFIVSILRSNKNVTAMRFPDRIEGFVQNVLEKGIVPDYPQYRRNYNAGLMLYKYCKSTKVITDSK